MIAPNVKGETPMSTANPALSPPDPPPDEIERGIAAIERHLASVAPVASDPAPKPLPVDVGETGETRRVAEMRREVAEARLLVDLQADPAPLQVDTPRVRRLRIKVAEAARLHALSQDPGVLAWRDQRLRRITTAMSMTAAGIALGASSIGVQASVATALDLDKYSPGWWAAFAVEPALSLPLLAAVAVQAYSAIRGRVVDRKSPEGKRLFRTEALLLGLTLTLNCWPALWPALSGDLLPLLVHALGPVAAVTAVWVLPTLWAVLAVLPIPASTPTPTAPEYSRNALGTPHAAGGGVGRGVGALEAHRARLRRLIAAGELPAAPSATAIRRALGCGTETATRLRDELAGGAT